VAAAAADINNRLAGLPIAHPTRHGPPRASRDLVVSAATLHDGGTLLRMAGASVEQMGQALRGYLSFLSPLVGDDLWSRKW
jgi:hypothetical protein